MQGAWSTTCVNACTHPGSHHWHDN